MTTQNERLRTLLAEARQLVGFLPTYPAGFDLVIGVRQRIDTALAEPDEGCLRCYALGELRAIDQRKNDEAQAEIRNVYAELHEARAEIERLTRQVDIQVAFKKIAQQERDEARALRAESDRVLASGVVVPTEQYVELVRAAGPNVSFLDELRLANERAETAQRERDEARSEVERLRWGNEMACENTPNPACQCAGCETARDRADRGGRENES